MFPLSLKKLNSLLLSVTLLLLALLLLVEEIPFAWQLGVFILLMVLTGIPHGATDHVVHQYVSGEGNENDNTARKEKGYRQYGRFLLVYLGIIAAYSLLWFWLPKLCLAIFLLMSFYHFGQSQLYYLKLAEKSLLKIMLYLSWGALIIGSIV